MGNRTFRIICFWMPCGVKRWCSNLPIWQTISKSFQPLLKFPFIIFIHSLQIIKTIDWGVHCLNGNTKLHQFRLIRLLCNGNTWHTVYHPQLPLSVAARFIIIILSDCEQVCTWNVSVCLCLPITSCIASFFGGGGDYSLKAQFVLLLSTPLCLQNTCYDNQLTPIPKLHQRCGEVLF